ncbi:MAG: flavodoxin domain-containing protein [Planctomycetes bacterium]|jgi:flavodoxin I|nr:flavodoxin domain-containing protein [Planctomycetota bacterium]MCL4731585.1 flavodoxin domain-containing protein [Planctomycetota bacterium]
MNPRVLVGYVSVGGNTAETANILAAAAREAGAEVAGPVDLRGKSAELLIGHDGLLLGEPTWGEGAHHTDFAPFDDSMARLLEPGRALAGVRAAAFGGCDRAYRNFGRAIELIEDRLAACGALVVQQGLKIELAHNGHSRAFTRRWAQQFVARVAGRLEPQAYRPAMTRADADAVMGITPAQRRARDNAGLML